MKILYVITGLTTGAAEMMLYKLLSKLDRNRFAPVVVSLMDRGTFGDRIEALGIPVYTLGMKQGGIPTPAAISRLIGTVRQLKPDLIQGWMYHGNLAAQLARVFSSYKIPVLWSIHYSIDSLAHEKRMTAIIVKFGAVTSKYVNQIVFSSQTSKLKHEALAYYRENSCVIYDGFDTSLFRPLTEARFAVRAELGLPETTFSIGLICRFHPMKDHANFLHAAALLLETFPDIHFLLAGSGVERENQSLLQLIQKLGILDRVHLLGERRDMPRLTAALDIATVASAYGESFPNVIGEAMSCGVPCAVTDVGDSAWIVGNTGRVIPPRDSEALANAWKELIELGTEGREILGKAARARILKYFPVDSVSSQYEKLYESVLAKKTRANPANFASVEKN